MAQQIQQMVGRLAEFLKRRELKGVLKIFFRNGRLILELILLKSNSNMSYPVLSKGLSTQIIVFIATAGGAAGFTLSWFSVSTVLVAPPLLISTLLLRSITQQILNQRTYLKFQKIVHPMLDDDNLKERVKEESGLVETPTETQLEEVIQKKVLRKPKGKTVYFQDFIREIPDSESDLDLRKAEIMEEPIQVRTDNEL